MRDDSPKPRHLRTGEGERMRVITDLVTVKATSADTGGAYSLYEVSTPPAGGCPPHTQRYDEEAFYVIEGKYAFLIADRTVELGPGDYVSIPRGTVHAFANVESEPARMLVLVTPGGVHDRFFDEVGDHADRAPWVPDMLKVLAVASKYGVEFSTTDAGRNHR